MHILYKLETKLLSWEYTVLPGAFKNKRLSKIGRGGGGGGQTECIMGGLENNESVKVQFTVEAH